VSKCDFSISIQNPVFGMISPDSPLEERRMHEGRFVFAQLMDSLPRYEFNKCVERYRGNHRARTFSCYDQFLTMAFAQLASRESLRDIEICLKAMEDKLYHIGFRCNIAKSTIADANEKRDSRIFSDFAQVLIRTAKELYAGDELGVDLDNIVYALDSSTIDLCLALFPWAKFRRRKGGIKLHTLLDLRGNLPNTVIITHAKVHDVNILDELTLEPGAIYLMDRAYVDFTRLYRLDQSKAFFVTRTKRNFDFHRVHSHKIEKSTGVQCNQTIALDGFYAKQNYPDKLRRVRYFDKKKNKRFVFLTNNFDLPPLVIAQLYQQRWQVELFFKWIKQHLRIKSFFGTTENAVKTQIWIAISIYLLVAIIKKRLGLQESLYTILQILSLTLFEKTPILQVISNNKYKNREHDGCRQLDLFDF
jgi:hypothetical protein